MDSALAPPLTHEIKCDILSRSTLFSRDGICLAGANFASQSVKLDEIKMGALGFQLASLCKGTSPQLLRISQTGWSSNNETKRAVLQTTGVFACANDRMGSKHEIIGYIAPDEANFVLNESGLPVPEVYEVGLRHPGARGYLAAFRAASGAPKPAPDIHIYSENFGDHRATWENRDSSRLPFHTSESSESRNLASNCIFLQDPPRVQLAGLYAKAPARVVGAGWTVFSRACSPLQRILPQACELYADGKRAPGFCCCRLKSP
ncbi:hypothetical protein MKZ38_007814 [Zalerion maritima]|uniref:Uncharacterized protein n=1 Tax=Zalerion maritima TaxID=339359 RepID=A0AAD5WNZ8_9PEZI|nr:hypothetical protein MKZ38_007814 [Zalerion maritima]